MENIYVNVETSSDDTASSSSDDDSNETIIMSDEFMNYTTVNDYEKNRNSLFTKDLETVDILVEHTGSFTSQKFYFSGTSPSLSYKNVIDVSLIKGFLKTSSTDNDILKIKVNNIPYRACVSNKDGKNIIDIIPLSNGVASTAGTTMLDHNYFFPVELDNIELELSFLSGAPTIEFFSFIFRLKMVKNLNLLK